ncbi:hypothetical protein WAX74_17140 [Psychrobacillus sp. FJAT-51614]|uniref:Gram-positive cocci surface proteins LPxTG domain-containing protein n=1 Tax=Psychrobacillus mangrovi TaxID=3117745 RepID=A0ABU8F996_9BACI
MNKKYFSLAIIFILCVFPIKSLASWAYPFVVWDGYVYVLTDEVVDEVEKEIGHVTKYSDMEGTYSGNFSNVYQKGTKYYSIVGVSTDEAIAVKNDGSYIKANRDVEYAGNKNDILEVESSSTTLIGLVLFILFITILGIYLISKRRK